jgi:hypothetical protein
MFCIGDFFGDDDDDDNSEWQQLITGSLKSNMNELSLLKPFSFIASFSWPSNIHLAGNL